MVRALLEKLRRASGGGGRPDRVSVLLPFLIISIGLGALAWRSYYLSAKMEESATTLAGQYAGYAAEITARRVDAAARAEMARVSDEWQQMERRIGAPTFAALRDWIVQHEWIVSAIYVPDDDPASSVYVADPLAKKTAGAVRISREFFTSSGSVRYTYDAERLLTAVHTAVRQQPLTGSGTRRPADVSLIRGVTHEGLRKVDHGFEFVAPLAQPLQSFGTRARVRTEYVGGSGWSNSRLLSLSVTFLAICLMGAGSML
ncbi:MAG TPA: hypothetical protein VEU30_12170, partial [Thermoanaerobaculia bacterium]|nr:hypothetical protein [Thermoanaerobaculia bacterium]